MMRLQYLRWISEGMVRYSKGCLRKYVSSYSIAVKERNLLFDQEKERQRQSIGRIKKIEVKYKGVPEDAVFSMNKGLSTPFNCAQHMSSMLVERSALGRVNGELWDMHRPLEEDCELQLLHFRDADPFHVNKAFWRTCSFLLGATVMNVFNDDVTVKLHSFPSPNVRSGSFVYDIELSVDDWKPSKDELRVISAAMVKLTHSNSQSDEKLKMERLDVDEDIALHMFPENNHKTKQIPLIASSSNDDKITLYRFQDHIDMSRGPLIANAAFIGRCSITAVHKIESDNANLYRFQGVALPRGIMEEDLYCKKGSLIPSCLGLPGHLQLKSVLDATSLILLNSSLPPEFRIEWHFLFSSSVHGESFSKVLGCIAKKGPTVIIVVDTGGNTFGGFAPVCWDLGPKFYGDDRSFLFSLAPKMGIYRPTGYNNHYMYLNIQQQTLPNGLGMGGQFGYFGLWIDAEFGKGSCSKSCTTFDCPPLSSDAEFEIQHVEVWSVGKPPPTPQELGERPSVLDGNYEAKALLNMAGKEEHSLGYREPEDLDL